MTRRRFRVGDHSTYDREFDRVKGSSNVLNPRKASHFSNVVVQLATASGCRQLLEQYERRGDPYGKFLREPYGIIQHAEVAIAKLEAEFETVRQVAVNKGAKPPEQMPKDLYRKLMLAQARHDVIVEEADLIRKKLAQFEDAAETVRKSAILPHGPKGHGRGDSLKIIDGQKVSATSDGVLYIDEVDSPYHLMALADYRQHVIGPFLRNPKINKLKKVAKTDLPPWPKAVKSVFADEKKKEA